MMRLLLAGLATLGVGSSIFSVREPRGIDFVHRNSPTSSKYLIETMGGGVAVFDYNNDGRLDVLLVNSGYLSAPMEVPADFRRSLPRYWNRLYRQEANGSFTDVTEAAGLADAGNANYGMGVAIGDYDNDGYEDIYITNYGKNTLLHNQRDGTFVDETQKAGVSAGGWSASAGFVDYDNDGRLDLFVTRYMKWNPAESKVCGGAYHTYCPPGSFPPTTNLLYHNNGDGTFTDVSESSGIALKQGRSLGVAFNDYDGDGFQDIFVANDGMEEFLFHNNRNGTFTERAEEAGVALTDDGSPYAGMGVDFRDYDNDGKPDILVTDLARQVYALYHNDGDGSFSYRSLQTGLASLSAASSGWGVGLVDFDNDGWKDIFAAQSHVMDNVEKINPAMHYKEPPLLALSHQGRFERANLGTETPVAGRGAAFGDLNHDGSMDAVVSVLGGAPEVLYNRGNGAHWLTLTLVGTRSNRDGIGARVVVNGQTLTVTTGGSYLSASDKRVHFGLADSASASIEVFWPSGAHQLLKTFLRISSSPCRSPADRDRALCFAGTCGTRAGLPGGRAYASGDSGGEAGRARRSHCRVSKSRPTAAGSDSRLCGPRDGLHGRARLCGCHRSPEARGGPGREHRRSPGDVGVRPVVSGVCRRSSTLSAAGWEPGDAWFGATGDRGPGECGGTLAGWPVATP